MFKTRWRENTLSVTSSSRRRPVQIFVNISNLAAINAWMLYKEVTGKSIARKRFILKLCEVLSADYVQTERRRHEVAPILHIPRIGDAGHINGQRKRRHRQIQQYVGNKSSDNCSRCNKMTCGQCTATKRRGGGLLCVYAVQTWRT